MGILYAHGLLCVPYRLIYAVFIARFDYCYSFECILLYIGKLNVATSEKKIRLKLTVWNIQYFFFYFVNSSEHIIIVVWLRPDLVKSIWSEISPE